MHAQSSTKPMKLSGTVCNSSCVTQLNNLATCDKECTDKSGPGVLVDDKGNVMKIANQEMCRPHMGKHVKMTAMAMDQPPAAAAPTEAQREQTLRIMEIEEQAP
jgi:hypothetical protein